MLFSLTLSCKKAILFQQQTYIHIFSLLLTTAIVLKFALKTEIESSSFYPVYAYPNTTPMYKLSS